MKLLVTATVLALAAASAGAQENAPPPHPVRNDVAQPGQEIVTIRYFKIKKGSFDQFLRVSQDDIWPMFNKIGARVIGMWKVFPVEGVPNQSPESKEYDEVYLSTRYASVDHWRATRDESTLGGNGPDFQRLQEGLKIRQSLTLETHVIFLQGAMATNGPYFMPALNETYEKK